MSNDNYTPEEVRLLDLCAASALPSLIGPDWDSEVAMDAYDLAATMIAERRKWVPQPAAKAKHVWVTDAMLFDGNNITFKGLKINGVEMNHENWQKFVGAQNDPCDIVIADGIDKGPTMGYWDMPQPDLAAPVAAILPDRQMDAPVVEPVAQPEPEKGELTEEAIKTWLAEARSLSYAKDDSLKLVHDDEISRAVALMREGLSAKRTAEVLRHKVTDLQRTVEQGADDLRAADESITIAKRERDTYKRLLDEGAKAVGHAAEKERDELLRTEQEVCKQTARLLDELVTAEKQRDEARRELGATKQAYSVVVAENIDLANKLAEAQPVLDAVVSAYPRLGQWTQPFHNTLQIYADRRREQAAKAGGAK